MLLFSIILLSIINTCTSDGHYYSSRDLVETSSTFIAEFLKRYSSDVSQECRTSLELYKASIDDFGEWGWQMFQATAKMPVGMLKGNVLNLGDYDTCVNLVAETNRGTVHGKYCLAFETVNEAYISNMILRRYSMKEVLNESDNISRKNVVLSWGLCYPSACAIKEAEQLFRYFYRNIIIDEKYCITKQNEVPLSNTEILITGLLLGWLLIIVLSTVYDFCSKFLLESTNSLLTSFSIWKNWRKLFYDDPHPERISCIDGISVLNTFSMTFGNEFLFFGFIPELRTPSFETWVRNFSSFEVVGSSFSSETFLLIGGFLTIYSFLRKTDRYKKVNPLKLILQYYLRFTIPVGALIIIHNILLDRVFEGPFLPFYKSFSLINCHENWWSTILHIQNYVNPQNLTLAYKIVVFRNNK